ncbi:MAG: hypothetical protein HY907_14175 [Deltaproteobacteria bacterium]|nr:hypothetical protein [Deltaproteobacteria bacterium]
METEPRREETKAATPRPARWRTAALLVLAVAAGAIVVESILWPDEGSTADRPPIRIDLGAGEPEGTEASAAGGDISSPRGDAARPAGEGAVRPLGQRLRELAESYVSGKLTIEALREHLTAARVAVNVLLINETAQSRVRWLARLDRALELASLSALLLLFGPLWIRWRGRGRPGAAAAAWAVAPYFIVAAAAILVVGNLLIGVVVGTEKIQVTVAALGSPAAAGADAALHYLAYGGDADVDRIFRLVFEAREAALRDPFSALGVAGTLWVAVQGVMDSTLLAWGRHLCIFLFHLLDLYGPILAALTLVVAWRVLFPLVRNLVRYPLDAAAGRAVPTLGRFALD